MILDTATRLPVPAAGEFDVALWQRLATMVLDEPEAALPFSARLARENYWSPTFTDRVIQEYRRFLYLAVRAGHPVTPSDEVDQAWHLHMLYSRHYWDLLCAQVLRQPLHHGPTLGGRQEAQKYGDWYERTKDAYRHQFAEEPPADIWPPKSRRFGGRHRRIDLRDCWVIPKPRLRWPVWMSHARSAVAGGAMLLAGGVADAASTSNAASNDGTLAIVMFASFLLIAAFTQSLAAALVGMIVVTALWSTLPAVLVLIAVVVGWAALGNGGFHFGLGGASDSEAGDAEGGGDGGSGDGGGCGGGCGGCGG